MELFLKRTKGSITVLVTLLLVPTIFFSGFLVDLARLKLYGNQAVMTADNYGEAVLSQYDNLLKELYGLFAVTQDEEALRELDKLQEYIKSSFDPSENTISWEHLQSIPGMKTSYEGFMPYAAAEVTLNREWIADANLQNEAVFATQIGDFMRFRIAQQLADDGSALLEAISQVQNTKDDARAIDKKLELDEEAQKLLEAAREYYLTAKEFIRYPDYILSIVRAYSDCETSFLRLTDQSKETSYRIYYDYETADADAMAAAVEKRDRIEAQDESAEAEGEPEDVSAEAASAPEESDTLTEEEQELVDRYDAWEADTEAREEKLREKLDGLIADFSNAAFNVSETYPVDFFNYSDRADALDKKAAEILRLGENLSRIKDDLEQILTSEDISEDLKEGIEEELEELEELFGQLDRYAAIPAFLMEYSEVNFGYQMQAEDAVTRLREIRDAYLACKDEAEIPDWIDPLDPNRWKKFWEDDADGKAALYRSLENSFEGNGAGEEGQKKKDEANSLLREAESSLEEKEESLARDIPESFGYGKNGSCRGFDLAKMAGEAAALFSVNGLKNAANKLLLKLYLTEYDFGMFTSRVTNTGAEAQTEVEVSLTGYEKTAKIHYLYQAELEYLLGGYNSSDENLGETRNKILAFRAVINYKATYSIREVNDAIRRISKAAFKVNPVLGLAVGGALRLAVAGVETALDWQALKGGESVIVVKTKLTHLGSYEKIKGLLNLNYASGQDDKAFRMGYEEYLLVMLLVFTSFDEIAQRTANLIELNVNTVRQKIGAEGVLSALEFQMKDAHTAVNATCAVHLDFAVIPSGFARTVAAPDDYDRLMRAEKNSYQFTVTRGY